MSLLLVAAPLTGRMASRSRDPGGRYPLPLGKKMNNFLTFIWRKGGQASGRFQAFRGVSVPDASRQRGHAQAHPGSPFGPFIIPPFHPTTRSLAAGLARRARSRLRPSLRMRPLLSQLGLTFCDAEGRLPSVDNHYCIWQFNFREFSLTDDMYAQACAARGRLAPPASPPPPPI